MDRFCLAGGGALRIGFASRRLLRRTGLGENRRLRGRAVLVLTSSKRTRVRGIRPGASRRALVRRLDPRRIKTGRRVWYVARGRKATTVFTVRHGRVREAGVAHPRLTDGRKRSRRFVSHFR